MKQMKTMMRYPQNNDDLIKSLRLAERVKQHMEDYIAQMLGHNPPSSGGVNSLDYAEMAFNLLKELLTKEPCEQCRGNGEVFVDGTHVWQSCPECKR